MAPLEFALENDLISPARQERSRKSLDKITTAAEMILRRDGAEGFSVNAVAEVSGISIGGIYARVKGKRELFELVKLDSTARIANRVRTRMQVKHALPADVVDSLIAALCSEFSRDENLHRALFSPGIASLIQNNHGSTNRMRSMGYFVDALLATSPELAGIERRDLELVGEMPISFITTAMMAPGKIADWDWVEASLKFSARAHLQQLIATQALQPASDQPHAA